MNKVALAAGVSLLLCGCSKPSVLRTDVADSKEPASTAPAKLDLKPAADRKAAPSFELKDQSGATVKLADYKGKVVLLNFWATWCGPCKVEIPWFVEFERANKDKNFAVIGMSMDDDGWTIVKPYTEEHKMNYRVLVGDDKISKDFGKLSGLGSIDSLPTTFLLDRDGKVAAVHNGLVSKSTYAQEISTLLSETL